MDKQDSTPVKNQTFGDYAGHETQSNSKNFAEKDDQNEQNMTSENITDNLVEDIYTENTVTETLKGERTQGIRTTQKQGSTPRDNPLRTTSSPDNCKSPGVPTTQHLGSS